MKLTIKTLKGGKFEVEAEASNTVSEVKAIIETAKSEFPADGMKLIHSGKVLKDDVTIESCNVKPNDFLVCMITKAKAKKKAAPASVPAPAPAQESTSETAAASATASTAATTTTPAAAASTTSAAAPPAPAAAASTTTTTAPTSSSSSSDEFPAEVIANLTGMGFPEAEALACLRAAQGNPDVAVEFLTNGIPPTAQAIAAGAPAPSGASDGAGAPLAALRNHPQFDQLRALVQSNPSSLQAVLTQIGEQQPNLLAEINANQPLFLQMMNEPVSADAAANASSSSSVSAPSGGGGGSRLGRMLGGGANPAQMAQMLSSMNPTELNEMATMMGLTPAQLTATAQMISQMPAEQFQEFVAQAMNQEGLGGEAGALGALGGLGGGPRQHILRLTEEEMAAVDRLTEMGFDRSEAAQAFLACDKNEALAANLLMDSAGEFGGGGFNGGGGQDGGADDTEDMYD